MNISVQQKGIKFQDSVGGVATGIGAVHRSFDSTWIGWPGVDQRTLSGHKEYLEKELRRKNFIPLYLSEEDINNYYYGFCNKTIWPLFHYFTELTVYDNKFWDSYRHVNQLFCDTVIKIAEPDDMIWIQDYHLLLLPKLLREKLPDAKIGLFLHIPFPSSEIFRLLPWRKQLLEGMLGANLVGVHTYDYVRHFQHSVIRILGYEHKLCEISINEHKTRIDTFPMGIDYDHYADSVNLPEVKEEIKKIYEQVGDRKIIFSIDRMDYTKGIPPRLEAFDLFLQSHPEYKEKVTLILVSVPTRTRVEDYKEIKSDVDKLVSSINGKHGTIGWTPVWYLSQFVPFKTLAALYNVADIGLVTPLRDGMNLIAKEFIASKRDEKGVLILSEMAGASMELGEAITVNPNNSEEVAGAIYEALNMECEEQKARNKIMRDRIKRYDIRRWADDYLGRLTSSDYYKHESAIKPITTEIEKQLIDDYTKSTERLIFLNVDDILLQNIERTGTIKLSHDLFKTLEQLTKEPRNEVVIASGRDKITLENWFGDYNVGFIAEHGAWFKEKNGKWKILEPMKNNWKNEMRPIFEKYTDTTPGSFIEEKDFSIAWHYRKAQKELGQERYFELKEALFELTHNLDLEIQEGKKSIEVRNSSVNKGRSARNWILKNNWDYILAVGDNKTDEEIFEILPDSAYSIMAGNLPSKAQFNMRSLNDITNLFKKFS